MSLKLYFHPLSSFCQKVLIAFYENDTPFEPHVVDLADAASAAAFKAIWPIGKFPVLRDDAKDRTIPEATGAYFDRLMERPSYARAFKEAQPYFALFPN